jgi:hypothetical protein
VLLASCALSAGIGFSSWWARSLVSATSFTVIGTVNKVITVLLNIALWNKHASPLGTAFLFVCIAGGAAYQQAPMRSDAAAKCRQRRMPALLIPANRGNLRSMSQNSLNAPFIMRNYFGHHHERLR